MKKVRAGAHTWALLIVVFLAVGVGSASSSSGLPIIKFGKHVCTSSLTRWGNCGAIVVASSSGTPLAGTTPPAGALGPSQFHSAYNLPTNAPAGTTIAIVDAYNDPSIESDLTAYDQYYGLPACTTANGCFRKVNQTGGTTYPATDAGWDLEIALDVETAHQICQNCTILLVEATTPSTTNLGAAENEAAALGADVISNSWLSGEYSSEGTDETKYFHHPGVAITAATGDNGYGVGFPAASRYVTAVGGTTLNLSSSGAYLGESAWSDAGSGCSRWIAKPAWQTDGGCVRRTEADVAADADPNTGAAVFDSVPYSGQTGWFQVGGTSLATPLIAGVYALAGQSSSVNDASGIYAHRSSLHDVTSGRNGYCGTYLCTATVGYDGPTGLGTPNGLGAFGGSTTSPPTPDFSLSASPGIGNVTAGGSTTYSISLNTSGGFSGTVGLSASGLPTGAQGVFTPTSISASTPSSTLKVTTTSTVTPGTYTVTVTGTSGTLTHITSASLVVTSPTTPDFSLGVTPGAQTVVAGAGTTYTVSLSRSGGFTNAVTFSASGLPAGASPSFSPSTVTGSSSTLTVSTTASVGSGSYPFTITGTSGTLVHSVGATLNVQAPSQTGGDFSISVSPSSGTVPTTGSTAFTVTITPTGGFTGSVSLSTGTLPHGVTSAAFSPNPTGSSSTLTVTTLGMRPSIQSFPIVITGTSGTLSHSTTLFVKV